MFLKHLFVFFLITSFVFITSASEEIEELEELEQEMRSLPIRNPLDLAKLLDYSRNSVADSQTFWTIKIGITNVIGGCQCANNRTNEDQKPKSAEPKPFYVRFGNKDSVDGHLLMTQKRLP